MLQVEREVLRMSYLGSKGGSGVYQKIIAEMPPHDTYIETHLGSGAVMLRKPPAMHNVGIDIDAEPLKEFAHRYNRLYMIWCAVMRWTI